MGLQTPRANTLKGIRTRQVEEQGAQAPVRGCSHVPLVTFFVSEVHKPLVSSRLVKKSGFLDSPRPPEIIITQWAECGGALEHASLTWPR